MHGSIYQPTMANFKRRTVLDVSCFTCVHTHLHLQLALIPVYAMGQVNVIVIDIESVLFEMYLHLNC